jgi:adenylate kinase family enzyme
MPTEPGSLLILTGPPGAGKSTVARLITENAPRPTAELTEIEPLRGMHGAFAALGELEQNVMDTSEQTVEDTADAVRRRARSAAFAL